MGGEQTVSRHLDDDRDPGESPGDRERGGQHPCGDIRLRQGGRDGGGLRERLLDRGQGLLGLGLVVAAARRNLVTPVPDLHLQRVELPVLGHAHGLKGEQVNEPCPIQQLVEQRAHVVGVLQELTPGLLRHVEEGVLSVDGDVSGGHRDTGPQPADVHGVDDAVGAVEEGERPRHLGPQVRVPEAAVVVDLPGLYRTSHRATPLGLSVRK